MSANVPVGQPPDQHVTQPTSGPRPTNGLAVAGMIVGIISICLVWVPLLGIVTLPTSLVAIGLSIPGFLRASKTGVGKGQAIAGLATGGATLVVGFLLFIVYVSIA